MNLQLNDTVYMNHPKLEKLLCKVVKVIPAKERAIGNDCITPVYWQKTECLPGYIFEVIENKRVNISGISHKKDSLKGMQYKYWGEHLTCSEFIFNQKAFEICLNTDNLPCLEGEEPHKVIFVKPEKIFTVDNTDYFVYKYDNGAGWNGKKSYSYGIAEYMTGISFCRNIQNRDKDSRVRMFVEILKHNLLQAA